MRQRLTTRMRGAADNSIPYPGNVNQPNRQDPAAEQYHTFEPSVENHELQDLRHDWKNDTRDDIGFGKPTVASVRVAANKAVRIAVLLLGEKAPEDVIEEQARDMMSMSHTAMDRTLARFAATQKFYAADEAPKAVETPAADPKEASKALINKEPVTAAPEVAPVAPVAPAVTEEPKAAAEAPKAEVAPVKEEKAASKKAADEPKQDEAEVVAADEKDLDIELQSAMDDSAEIGDDGKLAGLFASQDDADAQELPREASKKAGIKKLGGQPRQFTAAEAAQNIGCIWNDAPDVSEAFR